MNDLFKKSNQTGLTCIKSWLPNGRMEKNEWIALNPTRPDNNIGSFRINIITGKWIDHATSDCGNDAVSLYAYLNRSQCEQEAIRKKYKNKEGGVQAEAARLILQKYDPSYFPDNKDQFYNPPKKKQSKGWDDFNCLEKGMKEPPELKTDWYQRNWGKEKERWVFYDKKQNIVMCVIRFINEDGNKSDRPFTLWTNGQETKWRSKALTSSYPLYGLTELIKRPNDPVILFEGQKAASRANDIIGKEYVCVGWYGGVNAVKKTDWEPLAGKEIYFWPDADTPGRSVIKKLKELEIKIIVVYNPSGVKKGWDIADAIEEQWTKEKIIELIESSENKNKDFLDETDALPFRILGMKNEEIFFQCYRSKMVVNLKSGSLNANNLIRIAAMDWWGKYYESPNGGIAWRRAADDILRRAEVMPQFDYSIIRKSGAWMDHGNILFHAGEHLLIGKKIVDLCDKNGDHVYEKSRSLPLDINKRIDTNESKKLINVFNYIPMKHPAQKHLLTGWILLAPFGGALRWRPHIWITGPAGSGKSWLLENILYRLVGDDFGIKGMGTSTPAGIRQALQSTSLCVILDEMESDNKKYTDYIEQNLKQFREASSGFDGSATTLHGTIDQGGKQWMIKSMACFASIGASLHQEADMDRFTLLTLDTLDHDITERIDRFNQLKKAIEFLSPEWCRAFHARTYFLFQELLSCIDVMTEQATNILENRRYGDQIGTLIAGAWMVEHEKSATAKEAMDLLLKLNIDSLNNIEEKRSAEYRCLEEILSYRITVTDNYTHSMQTIGSCIEYIFDETQIEEEKKNFPGATDKGVKRLLEQYGLKPIKNNGKWLQVANSHPALRRILEKSCFDHTYTELLMRIDISDGKLHGPGNFAGIRKRYFLIDAEKIIDDIPF